MANHSSTKKSVRQTKKRRLRNKSRYSEVKTYIKKLALEKDFEKASTILAVVQSKIFKSVNRNILKSNAASRKISKLHAKVKALKES